MINTQIKTFLAVCDAGSFSGAAGELYMTPSAVLQQMKALEKDLGVQLFFRKSTGVTLTPAGAYMENASRSLLNQSKDIRDRLKSLGALDRRIIIASSLMEKVRLLYDLWILYSQQSDGYEIQMLNVSNQHNIPSSADLVESVNSGVFWMQDWKFLEICRVPMGFAVSDYHRLSKKECLTLQDLRTEQIVSLNSGSCSSVSSLLSVLRENHISVEISEIYKAPETQLLWQSAFSSKLLLVPLCWSDILFNMKVIPFEQNFTLPYGIFYRHNPTPAVQQFLDFIRQTYHEGNVQGIVPVLD